MVNISCFHPRVEVLVFWISSLAECPLCKMYILRVILMLDPVFSRAVPGYNLFIILPKWRTNQVNILLLYTPRWSYDLHKLIIHNQTGKLNGLENLRLGVITWYYTIGPQKSGSREQSKGGRLSQWDLFVQTTFENSGRRRSARSCAARRHHARGSCGITTLSWKSFQVWNYLRFPQCVCFLPLF